MSPLVQLPSAPESLYKRVYDGSSHGDCVSLTAELATPRVAAGANRRWWIEVGTVLSFYVVYSMVRNQFGSAAVDPELAYQNAERVIDIERKLGLFHEQRIQSWFGDSGWFFQSWNIFYGTLHFGATIFCFVYLYRKAPARYGLWRSTFALTTAIALFGFSAFPLMPPRLLNVSGPFGGLRFGGGQYAFVDSVAEYGGLWSFDSGTMQSISNQYAAMPSLHFAWATWCAIAVVPVLHNRFGRWFLALYPLLTLFAIVVTGNHYWIDALGGAIALGVAYLIARVFYASIKPSLHQIATKTPPT